jgi:mRNA interferase RelE/StbE
VNIKFYNNTSLKFLAKQPKTQQERIFTAIRKLPNGDVKLLAGKDSFLRLRVGDYRVIFVVDGETIIIRDIGNRGDIYK